MVGTLRDKKPLTEPEYNPDEDDQAPDMASIEMDDILREAGAPDTAKTVSTNAKADGKDTKAKVNNKKKS